MRARRNALQAANRDRGWLAWHIGILGRMDAKRFPKFDKFVGPAGGDPPRPKVSSWKTQMAAALAWNTRVNAEARSPGPVQPRFAERLRRARP